jgi:Kelch motif
VLKSIERAAINADGSLGQFAIAPDTVLSTARVSHTSVVVDDYLYVLGGVSGISSPLASVERAFVGADGALGLFLPVSGVAITTTRCGHASTVLGSSLYVIGGLTCGSPLNDPPLALVERAAVGSDGSIGSFATVPGVALNVGRSGCAITLLGGYLYVSGGDDSQMSKSIERSLIGMDGSLGAFATTSATLLAPRSGRHQIVTLGNTAYLVGATTAGGSATIEQATLTPSTL